ncbi:NAD(P)-binding protein [Microbacterium lushaniae]|uniref:NAD(P)-binding protein n=1 Tax=Microbacterium lushaniae TaxID=2614639 RepID=A0A5J6L8F7_9MICO|nr:NAD(P)-binding protein [Microbacterium lushaniae]
MRPHRAVVAGAGIAGLAAANALVADGWEVDVFDRAPALRRGGTALGMWPSAMAVLDRLGVGAAVRSHAVEVHGGAILRPDGATIGRIPAGRSAHLVSRARLLETLHDALPAGTVRWSRPVEAGEHFPGADLVVAADGIHSRLRTGHWADAAARPLGTVAFRGVVPGHVDTVTETWGRGAMFGITPSSDGMVNWFACLHPDRVDPGASSPTALLRTVFASWHAAIGGVLAAIADDGVDRRDLFDVRVPGRFARGNVVLVGDAAHAMAPNLGRGACESLLDVWALSRSVCTDGIETGLRRYDRMRRRRVQRIVTAARLVNRVATAQRLLPVRTRAARLLLA